MIVDGGKMLRISCSRMEEDNDPNQPRGTLEEEKLCT